MNNLLGDSLDRTLLLMRDELRQDASDADLLAALTGTEVVIAGSVENLASHSAQSAFVTAALLMARSGHRVFLVAPDLLLAGRQPPLKDGTLVSSLLEIGRDLLPGIEFAASPPAHAVDLCVTIGDSPPCAARHAIALNASAWSAWLNSPGIASRWKDLAWPFGGCAAGALAAGEAFKVSMRRLRRFARSPVHFAKLFAFSSGIKLDLARSDVPAHVALDEVDLISGGAIANAALYCFLRVPSIAGAVRIIENTSSDYSNLNRYALLRRSAVFQEKADTLLTFAFDGLDLRAERVRYDEQSAAMLAPLAPRVVVGVDHIPSRWLVQQMQPNWLAVGATTHWNAMASFHEDGLACARCLHPRDDDNDAAIPTVAFVSFWAGLLSAAYLVRRAASEVLAAREQHIFLTPLRPESPWLGPIARRSRCPFCGGMTRAA